MHVYVIAYGPLDTKIGVSRSPPGRLRQLRPGGAERVVRCWLRDDARAVEASAHRLLAPWRIPIPGTRERFAVGADAACRAVDLAAMLAAEARDAATDRARLAMVAERDARGCAPPPPVSPPGAKVGLALGADAAAAAADAEFVTSGGGVKTSAIHVGIGSAGARRAARRAALACGPGDLLVAAAEAALPPDIRALLETRGAGFHALRG